MTTFTELLKKPGQSRKAPRVVELGPESFAHTSDGPRVEGARIGIRLISEDDVQGCRAEAAQEANRLHPGTLDEDKVAAFNDALVRCSVARAACKPEDTDEPFFALGELEIRHKLTSAAIKRLYLELDTLHVASSPTAPEIDEEGFAHLLAIWGRNVLEQMEKGDRARVLRLLEAAREMLEEAEQALTARGISTLG